jgi:hypothetical protein
MGSQTGIVSADGLSIGCSSSVAARNGRQPETLYPRLTDLVVCAFILSASLARLSVLFLFRGLRNSHFAGSSRLPRTQCPCGRTQSNGESLRPRLSPSANVSDFGHDLYRTVVLPDNGLHKCLDG